MKAYNSSKDLTDSGLTVDSDNEMTKAELAAQDAQGAIDQANAALAEVTDDNGTINVGLFKSTGTSNKGLAAPIVEKLTALFDKVFAKAGLVKDAFAKARQALNDALAKIDQSNPANQAQVALIMANLAKIDQLEAKFSEAMHTLASKLDLAVSGLDGILSGLTTWLPGWGSLIGMVLDMVFMQDIRDFILELKAKLMAL